MSENGYKQHVCPVCQYTARTSSNMKRHMGIHEDIREYKCDICSLCFRQKIHLERHIKYKHEEKSVKCPLCDYICANEQPDLKIHIRRKHPIEDLEEEFTCPECKVQLGTKKDLKQHMKFHKDGPKPKLLCKECSFVTDCQSRLQRHVAIHSKLKPFQCGVCDYRGTQKDHLVRHLQTKHKIDIKKDGKRPWKRRQKTATEDGSKERADFTSGDKTFASNHCTLSNNMTDQTPSTPNSNVFVITTQTSESSSREVTGDLTSVTSVNKIEDLTRMTASGKNEDMQALVIDSRGTDVTEIVHTTAHAPEALEGSQALAEQAGLIDNIIEEQIPSLDEQQTIVLEQNDSTTEIVGSNLEVSFNI